MLWELGNVFSIAFGTLGERVQCECYCEQCLARHCPPTQLCLQQNTNSSNEGSPARLPLPDLIADIVFQASPPPPSRVTPTPVNVLPAAQPVRQARQLPSVASSRPKEGDGNTLVEQSNTSPLFNSRLVIIPPSNVVQLMASSTKVTPQHLDQESRSSRSTSRRITNVQYKAHGVAANDLQGVSQLIGDSLPNQLLSRLSICTKKEHCNDAMTQDSLAGAINGSDEVELSIKSRNYSNIHQGIQIETKQHGHFINSTTCTKSEGKDIYSREMAESKIINEAHLPISQCTPTSFIDNAPESSEPCQSEMNCTCQTHSRLQHQQKSHDSSSVSQRMLISSILPKKLKRIKDLKYCNKHDAGTDDCSYVRKGKIFVADSNDAARKISYIPDLLHGKLDAYESVGRDEIGISQPGTYKNVLYETCNNETQKEFSKVGLELRRIADDIPFRRRTSCRVWRQDCSCPRMNAASTSAITAIVCCTLWLLYR